MKIITQLLAATTLTCAAFAQTAAVTKNPATNAVNGGLVITEPNALQVDGTLRTGARTVLLHSTAGINFGSVGSALLVTGQNRHAVIARTPNATDGIALVGWSSSGASAVKAAQDTHFTSPALTVWRNPTLGGDLSESPGVLVAAIGTPVPAASAAEVRNASGATTLKITWEGDVTTRGVPLMRWRGEGANPPTTDLKNGDMFYNFSTSQLLVRTSFGWVPVAP